MQLLPVCRMACLRAAPVSSGPAGAGEPARAAQEGLEHASRGGKKGAQGDARGRAPTLRRGSRVGKKGRHIL
jgi:hypothetical protein